MRALHALNLLPQCGQAAWQRILQHCMQSSKNDLIQHSLHGLTINWAQVLQFIP